MQQTAEPALENLHDIVLPQPVSWAPQAVGWWILLAFTLLLLAWAGHALYRRSRANRYRRSALASLDRIEAALTDTANRAGALRELPVLVKRTALAFCPRRDVAALNGQPWLQFLDESYQGRGFTEGPGRLLPTLAYASRANVERLAEDELNGLIRLVRQWIRRHRVRV